ncbi:MAG: DNRLRE domain-containing protein [Sedimentisphaerales bacterium]|nr:DNRLRE domain-containing protein [Sedimentisphaerales bacterium]
MMKKLSFVAMLVLAMALPAAAAVEYNLDYTTGVLDGWVEAGYGGVPGFDNSSDVELRAEIRSWVRVTQTMVKFDLSSVDTTGHDDLMSATLTMHIKEGCSSAVDTVKVWQMNDVVDWTTDATMVTYDGTNDWPDLIGLGYPVPYASSIPSSLVEAAPVTTNNTDITWDVTDIVRSWLFDGKGNMGFLIGVHDAIEGAPGYSSNPVVVFWPEEYAAAEGDATLAARLDVVVPEPMTMSLLGLGGLVGLLRRRK